MPRYSVSSAQQGNSKQRQHSIMKQRTPILSPSPSLMARVEERVSLSRSPSRMSMKCLPTMPLYSQMAPAPHAPVAENTPSGINIGAPVSATDNDNDTLTYSLGGDDAAAFNIINTSGQLQTRASLDYETKDTYTVRVSVSDGKGGTDSITVTITVTDVTETPTNNAPVFTDGTSTTRSIAENTPFRHKHWAANFCDRCQQRSTYL